MSGQAAVRRVRAILLGTAFLAVASALLGPTVPVEWYAMVERMEVLPWGGPLWWLFRAALATGVF